MVGAPAPTFWDYYIVQVLTQSPYPEIMSAVWLLFIIYHINRPTLRSFFCDFHEHEDAKWLFAILITPHFQTQISYEAKVLSLIKRLKSCIKDNRNNLKSILVIELIKLILSAITRNYNKLLSTFVNNSILCNQEKIIYFASVKFHAKMIFMKINYL